MWWHRRFIIDLLIIGAFCLVVVIHVVALLAGAWFGLYFLWMLFDTSVYLFIGFVCLCYLAINCYYYAFDHDQSIRTL